MKFIITLIVLLCSVNHTMGQDIGNHDKLYEKYEHILPPKFIDSVSIDHLLFKKFGSDIYNVKKLTLTIDVDKHGRAVEINYYLENETDNFTQEMFEEIKKFIIQNCRWKPAHGITYKGKKERVPYHLVFGWERIDKSKMDN